MKSIIFVLLAIIATSCVSSDVFEKKLNKKQYQLGYIFNSKIDSNKVDKKVLLKYLDKTKDNFSTKVKVIDESGWFILIGGGGSSDYDICLGKNSTIPNFNDFFVKSFLTEAERSGKFQTTNSDSTSDFILELTLLNYEVEAKYSSSFFVLMGGFSSESKVKPSWAQIRYDVKLKDKDSVVFNKKYSSGKYAYFVEKNAFNDTELIKFMMTNLAESASINTKHLVETIVQDINAEILKY